MLGNRIAFLDASLGSAPSNRLGQVQGAMKCGRKDFRGPPGWRRDRPCPRDKRPQALTAKNDPKICSSRPSLRDGYTITQWGRQSTNCQGDHSITSSAMDDRQDVRLSIEPERRRIATNTFV